MAKFTSRMWTKKETQETITALREAGYKIVLENDMYKSTMKLKKCGTPIFTAMKGNDGYLVRYDLRLLGEET